MRKKVFLGYFLTVFLKKFLCVNHIAPKFLKVLDKIAHVSYRLVSYKKRVYDGSSFITVHHFFILRMSFEPQILRLLGFSALNILTLFFWRSNRASRVFLFFGQLVPDIILIKNGTRIIAWIYVLSDVWLLIKPFDVELRNHLITNQTPCNSM